MRFIKLGLFSLVFFFLLLTGIASLLPSSINISRAIDINTPVDTVFTYVNNMQNWKKWYGNVDSSTIVLSSVTQGTGASLTLGNTMFVRIEEVVPGKKIKAVWKYKQGTPLPGEFNFFPQKTAAQTTLQWQFVQRVKWYPWEKFAAIFSGKTTGPFMEQSLDKLKKNLENRE